MSSTTPDEIEIGRSSTTYVTEVSWGACGPSKAQAYRNFLEATAKEAGAEFRRVKIPSTVHSPTQKWVNGSRKIVKDLPHFTIEVSPSHDGRELKAHVNLDPWQYRKPEYYEIPLPLITEVIWQIAHRPGVATITATASQIPQASNSQM